MNRNLILWMLVAFSAILNAQGGKVYYDPLRVIATADESLSEAVQLIRFGNPEGAIRYIKSAEPESKRTFEADFLLGYAYRLQGDLDEAISYFSKAARQQSLSLPAYFERGNCYLIRKNFSLAVFDFDRAILIDTNFAPAYNNRAYARIRNYGEQKMPTQQLKFARKDMEKVLSITQSDSIIGFEYYYNLGLLDLYMSEYELAISSFDKAVKADQSVSKLYYFRGAAFFLARYYNKAREDFSTAEALGFSSGQAPEFMRVLELIKQHEETTGEKVGK